MFEKVMVIHHDELDIFNIEKQLFRRFQSIDIVIKRNLNAAVRWIKSMEGVDKTSMPDLIIMDVKFMMQRDSDFIHLLTALHPEWWLSCQLVLLTPRNFNSVSLSFQQKQRIVFVEKGSLQIKF